MDARIGVGVLDIPPAVAARVLPGDLGAAVGAAEELQSAEWRRPAGKHLEGRAVVVRVGVRGDRVVFEIRSQLGDHAEPRGDVIGIVEILRADRRLVVEVSPALHVIDAEPDLERFGQRHVDHALHAPHVVVAGRTLEIALELAGRPVRHQQHRAAGGVAAEQRALRPLQHLHVLQVEQVADGDAIAGRGRRGAARPHDIGEIDADRWRGGEILDEAANCESRLFGAVAGVDRERRGVGRKVGGIGDVARGNRFLVVDRDRDRHVLQPFLDAPRSDDDVVARSLFGLLRILRHGRHGPACRKRARRERQLPDGRSTHKFLPQGRARPLRAPDCQRTSFPQAGFANPRGQSSTYSANDFGAAGSLPPPRIPYGPISRRNGTSTARRTCAVRRGTRIPHPKWPNCCPMQHSTSGWSHSSRTTPGLSAHRRCPSNSC